MASILKMPPWYRRAHCVEESCGVSYLGRSAWSAVVHVLTMGQSSSVRYPVFWCLCTLIFASRLQYAVFHKLRCQCELLHMIPSWDLVTPWRYDFAKMYLAGTCYLAYWPRPRRPSHAAMCCLPVLLAMFQHNIKFALFRATAAMGCILINLHCSLAVAVRL